MPDTLQEYRRQLAIQNQQQQVRDNNEAARKFRQIEQDVNRFPVSAQKGPAFESFVNRLGQERTPDQLAVENARINAALAAQGADTVASDFSINENRRFAPAFRVNQTGQPFPQAAPTVPDARSLPTDFSRQAAPQIGSAFRTQRGEGQIGSAFRTQRGEGQIGTAFRTQRGATTEDFIDGLVDGQGRPIQRDAQGNIIQPTEIGTAFRAERQPDQTGVTTPQPTQPVAQQQVTTVEPTQPGTVGGAQVSTQQTQVEQTPTGWFRITDNQIARFQGSDDVNRNRITNAYSTLSDLLNENNLQYQSLTSLVDRDEKWRLIDDQQYYTSVYGPGGEMERLNNEFYTGMQDFLAKQGAERQALATSLATRTGATQAQVASQLAQQEAQQLQEILKVKQQQLWDLDRVRRTFIDLEQRFRQEYANSTDKNIVNTFKEIKNQKDQVALAYTEAIRQYDQQLQALNMAASGGTRQTTPAQQWRFLSNDELNQLTPLEREQYINQLATLQANAQSLN